MAARGENRAATKKDLRIERKSNMWRITVYKIHNVARFVKRHFFIFP